MELTDQQKLEILCAYLPYGIDIKSPSGNVFILGTYSNMNGSGKEQRGIGTAVTDNYQPMLRHPDDMTEEELQKLANITDGIDPDMILLGNNLISLETSQSALLYLHSIHIDTFGAIEAGFAIRKTN
jgi:hypothetical protein